MADSVAHIPTQGAAQSPIRYFGDVYLLNADFLARLPTAITRRLALRGIDAPTDFLAPYIFDSNFTKTFMPFIKEAFVNELLNGLPKADREPIKAKLKQAGKWEFNSDREGVTAQPTNIYS